MTAVTAALIVTDAKKSAAVTAIASLTLEYTIGFTRVCCAVDPNVTFSTPPTHWYSSGASFDVVLVEAWRSAVDASGPSDSL